MPDSTGPHFTLLDELDARQDQALAELEELNRRIEQLLREFTQPQRPDSPAEKAGIRLGDVILEFNGQELRESSQLPPLVGNVKAGNSAELTVLRQGKKKQIDTIIGELPGEDEPATIQTGQRPETSSDRLGLNVSDMSEIERQKLGLPGDAGVLVGRVAPGVARAAGIAEGDVILMLDGRKVTSAGQFRETIDSLKPGKTTAMLIHKPNGPVFIALRIPE